MRSPLGRLKQFIVAIINPKTKNTEQLILSGYDGDIAQSEPSNSFTNAEISFVQTGFLLNGECNVPFDVRCILVASIGEQILGMVALPKLRDKTTSNTQGQLNFTMPLAPSVLSANVSKQVTFTIYGKTVAKIATLPCVRFLLCAVYQPFSIKKLAPSYGFFGGGKQDPLNIVVDLKVSVITLGIAQPNSILNLREIRLFDSQDNQIIIDQNIEVSCSSNKINKNSAKNILKGEGFHSTLEDKPWLTIHFKQRTKIGRIEVTNRTDFWGCRAQKLEVTAIDYSQQKHVLHAPFTEQAIVQFYAQLMNYLGADCLTIEDEVQRKSQVLAKTLEYLNQDNTELNPQIFQYFLQLLSTWENKPPANDLLELELNIIAIYIFYCTEKDLKFYFQPFSTLLSRESDWEYLEKQVNAQRIKHGLGTVTLSENGIAAQNDTVNV